MTEEAIIISVPDGHPAELFEFIESDLCSPDFKVKTLKTEHGAMAGIEWLLPTVVVAYLLKPFFEAALQEAGKDFYELSKSKIKQFITRNRALKYKYVAATISTEKLSKNYNQSITVSIKAFLHSKVMITVLFDETVAEEEMDDMLEVLFLTLNKFYVDTKQELPEGNYDIRNVNSNEIFFIANPELRQWQLLSKEQMNEKFRNK